jgi:hypothetical protein
MGLTYAALDSAWAQMGDATKVHPTPAGKGRFRVLKSTKIEMFVKPVGGRARCLAKHSHTLWNIFSRHTVSLKLSLVRLEPASRS